MKYLSKSTRFILSLAGVGTTALLFAGCSSVVKPTSSIDSGTQQTTPTEETSQNQMTPIASPNLAASDANSAATSENMQLNALNKDATSVDQSFNDQAVNVQ